MARLIDADALLESEIRRCGWIPTIGTGYINEKNFKSILAEAPTVDAVPVVHGRWEYYSTTMQECSNCHRHTARHKFKHCPHCGAVMEDKYNESTD